MITSITIHATDSVMRATITGRLTAGAVGIPVFVTVSGERWEGLSQTLVACAGTETRKVMVVDGVAALPWECLIAYETLLIGLDGRDEAGNIRIPTVWFDCGIVEDSPATVEAGNAAPPTPELVDQILAVANQATKTANEALKIAQSGGSGGGGGVSVVNVVEAGNMNAVTSNAVHVLCGNIEALMGTI